MTTIAERTQPRLLDNPPQLSHLALHIPPPLALDNERLWHVCHANRSLRIERTASGDLDIMPPTGAETGARNADLIAQCYLWARRDGRGIVFDSSTGFLLPNGAMRSPDLAWVRREHLNRLNAEQKRGFLPLAPDALIELASASDDPARLQEKMQEWITNGTQLGWLILPKSRQVWCYTPDTTPRCLESPTELSNAALLPGLNLILAGIWEPGF